MSFQVNKGIDAASSMIEDKTLCFYLAWPAYEFLSSSVAATKQDLSSQALWIVSFQNILLCYFFVPAK